MDRLFWTPLAARVEARTTEKAHPAWPAIADDLYRQNFSGDGMDAQDQDLGAFLRSTGMFAWVAACVKAKEVAAASVPLRVVVTARDGTEETVAEHPLLALFADPNPEDGYAAFWRKTVQQLEYSGESFWAMDGDPSRPDSIELWPMRSDAVTIVPSKQEAFPVREYRYSASGGKSIRLEPSEVIHIKYPHPTDPLHGLSPMKELETTLSLLAAAQSWNKTFFQNAARLSGVLSVPGNLSQVEFDRLSVQLAKRHGGGKNAHKMMITEGGASFAADGSTPREAEFLGMLSTLREEIHAVYRVPPVQTGILEHASYANAREQNREFYRSSIIPLNALVTEHLNAQPLVKV
ncbi:MAG: phage portal protein, partial [Gemmatimonadota bacterium]|nr:phage portal protein [Gemmatimonadota bacterium]